MSLPISLAVGLPAIMPAIGADAPITMGESILFWILAPLMVLAAIGIALSRKAVHAAVCMVGVMLCLAAFYVANNAPFLGVVQVVVYTGAIMMLILFVIMMVGVSASDNYSNTPLSLRIATWIMGILAAAGLVITAVLSFAPAGVIPVAPTAAPTNPVSVAAVLFQEHIFTMHMVDMMLITAVIGAMTLTHTDRLTPKKGQIVTSHEKMEMYAAKGTHPGQLPAPGVYVGGNAPDAPAISGETGKPVPTSVPRMLRIRGLDRSLAEVSPQAVEALRQQAIGDPAKGLHTIEATRAVAQSQSWGMPGATADFSLRQPGTKEVEVAAEKNNDVAVSDTDQTTDKASETATKQDGEATKGEAKE